MPHVHEGEENLLIPHNWSTYFRATVGSNHSKDSSTYKDEQVKV